MYLRSGLALVFAGIVAACADGVQPTLTPAPMAPLTTSVGDAPAGDPGEPLPVAIRQTSAGIFPEAGQWAVKGSMRYDSYHARITARASISGPDINVQHDFFPQTQDTFWAFFDNVFEASWNWDPYTAECGHRYGTDMQYEVWWAYAGGWNLDSKTATNSSTWRQESCEEMPVPGGGTKIGGPGEGSARCYTYTVDPYWYYPETGEYEYRYSTTQTWCEPASSS